MPFSDALDRHRDVFPPYYIGILRSAELTGQLDTVLEQLSSYIERDLEARQKIKSALTYPIVIMVMSIVTVVVLVVVRAAEVHRRSSRSSTPSCRCRPQMLLDFADFFETWWWALALGVAGDRRSLLIRANRTEGGQRSRDEMLLRLPVDRRRRASTPSIERFCRIIAAMMHAGVPLPDAMQAAIDGCEQRRLRRRARRRARRDARGRGHGRARSSPPGCSRRRPRR